MSDERSTPADAMAGASRNVALAQAELDRGGPGHEPEQATLLVAHLTDPTTADAAYTVLREGERAGRFHVEGVVVVAADEKGELQVRKMTDHSTRKGLKWGIAGGALAAAFLPVTLVGGAVVLGVAGATAGAARLRGRRKEVTAQLKEIVKPGESAIMCMVEDSMEADVEEALAPYATEIRAIEVDAGSPDAVREATKAAEIAEAEIARAPENEPINWG